MDEAAIIYLLIAVCHGYPNVIPPGYNKSSADGKYYKYVAEKKRWIDAVEACQKENATLAMIKTRQEYEELRGLLGFGKCSIISYLMYLALIGAYLGLLKRYTPRRMTGTDSGKSSRTPILRSIFDPYMSEIVTKL